MGSFHQSNGQDLKSPEGRPDHRTSDSGGYRADHQHPSFNRKGDRILFSNPDENGAGQVCVIDLNQVWKDW